VRLQPLGHLSGVKSASGSFLTSGCRRPDGPTKPATSSFDFMGLMEEPQAADS
jgi:hypothetical protein